MFHASRETLNDRSWNDGPLDSYFESINRPDSSTGCSTLQRVHESFTQRRIKRRMEAERGTSRRVVNRNWARWLNVQTRDFAGKLTTNVTSFKDSRKSDSLERVFRRVEQREDFRLPPLQGSHFRPPRGRRPSDEMDISST